MRIPRLGLISKMILILVPILIPLPLLVLLLMIMVIYILIVVVFTITKTILVMIHPAPSKKNLARPLKELQQHLGGESATPASHVSSVPFLSVCCSLLLWFCSGHLFRCLAQNYLAFDWTCL